MFAVAMSAFAWVRGAETEAGKVTGQVLVLKEINSFTNRVLEVRLYQIHPQLVDAPADLVEKLAVKNLAHAKGVETTFDFVIGSNVKVDPKLKYYVTVAVLAEGKRTHIGESAGMPFCYVLTLGGPREVKFTLRPAG